jgi:hypothetical protein
VYTLYCLEEWRGEQRISPPGDNFTPPGTTSPLGSKFSPRSEVKSGPLVTCSEWEDQGRNFPKYKSSTILYLEYALRIKTDYVFAYGKRWARHRTHDFSNSTQTFCIISLAKTFLAQIPKNLKVFFLSFNVGFGSNLQLRIIYHLVSSKCEAQIPVSNFNRIFFTFAECVCM